MNTRNLVVRSQSLALAAVLAIFALPAQQKTAPGAGKSAPSITQNPSPGTKPWEVIKIPPLHSFKPQQPKRIELENGMVIFLQEDHELPLIDSILRIRGGSRLEPAEKAGLVSMFGQSWRTGGTISKTGDQLDDFLEARAAKVETSGGIDSTNLTWSCLKPDFADVFQVVLDLLRNPAFHEDKIELARKRTNAAISRRNDTPGQIATREAAQLAYGTESPYARVPQYYTVNAIQRDDLVRWHQRYVIPNNIILGIVGDFDSTAMEAKLRAAFADWPKGQPTESKPENSVAPVKPGYYLVEKNDINQSTVEMVHQGIRRDNPDYYAVTVMNEVLGGGFSGRLMSNCRTKQGLAYDVHGGVGSGFDHPGIFQLVVETKSGTTAKAIDCLYQQLDDLDKKPATIEELKRAKDTILNSFIFEFDDKEKVLEECMRYEFYGYPADYLDRFRAGVEKVTTDDVARAAYKYVHKNQLAVLVVGNSPDFDRPLSSFGPVHKLDIDIPENPPGKVAASLMPATSNSEGMALAAKFLASLGSESSVKAVKSIRQKTKSLRKTPQGDVSLVIEQTLLFPDHLYASVKTPRGTITLVITPEAEIMSNGAEQHALPAADRDENLKSIQRDLLYIAQHVGDPRFTFTAVGHGAVEGADAAIVEVNANSIPVRWFVDPATGRVLRSQFHTLGNQGPVERVVDYSDWRENDGITLPYRRIVTENNEITSQDTVQSIELNPAVDLTLFAPATAPSPDADPIDKPE